MSQYLLTSLSYLLYAMGTDFCTYGDYRRRASGEGYQMARDIKERRSENECTNDVVLRHTLPVFTGLGRCPIVNWDFVGAVSIFGPDALPVIHQ